MVLFHASTLPLSHSFSASIVTSLIFHPPSLSLALMHSNSSFSLYPSIPFPLPPSLPPPQTTVSSPTSSATFLHLQSSNPNSSSTPSSRHLFLTSSPLLGGSSVLLRFYVLLPGSQSFARARVLCNQKDLRFDDNRFGVVFGVSHGISVKLVGSVNFFAMHSVSNRKIWIFAMKMVDERDDGVTVKLMRCAVIDCCVPVFSVSVSFGLLLLGEENGVRIFPLRPLVNGRLKKHKKVVSGGLNNGGLEIKRLYVPNSAIQTADRVDVNSCESSAIRSEVEVGNVLGTQETTDDGPCEMKIEKQSDKVKVKPVRLRQDSTERGAQFVVLRKGAENLRLERTLKTAKAVSIQALSMSNFLVLDSVGDLHLISLTRPFHGSETFQTTQLTHNMRVEKLAVLCDTSTTSQIIWISDGRHTVHVMAVSDIDAFVNENNRPEPNGKPTWISVEQAIFASEKIKQITPFGRHAALILGQGSISAYAIC